MGEEGKGGIGITWWFAIRTMRVAKLHCKRPSGRRWIWSETLESPLTWIVVVVHHWVMDRTRTVMHFLVKAMKR